MNTKKIDTMTLEDIQLYDKQHVWHPYTSMTKPLPTYLVESAQGVYLKLSDGKRLIDGMSSWWSVVNGYNHPRLNAAATKQLEKMSHVMFGGITHQPAVELAKMLIDMTSVALDKVFFCDSGSVAVEVAIKMAIQYHHARGNSLKSTIATFKGGYHGDTWHAMSVCDPVGGMHALYHNRLPEQIFVERPSIGYNDKWDNTQLELLEECFDKNHRRMAAFILEPVVQGAGGMWFYHPNYLKAVRELCNKYDVLLIADEIATGFGRTGKIFGCEHASIAPDIMCVGKALTGGYMTLAAVLTTSNIAQAISNGDAGCFMHGPTFMANPLACAVALENLKILDQNPILARIAEIEKIITTEFEAARSMEHVAQVRVLGAIGVIEMKKNVDLETIQAAFVQSGVWVRPFGKLVYIMPPYVITDQELTELCQTVVKVVSEHK